MRRAIFLRLLRQSDKGIALVDAAAAVRGAQGSCSIVYDVDPASFRYVPGSPFPYWVTGRTRRLFSDLSQFGSDGRAVKQGLATADDFRFARAWWEVEPAKILTGTKETTPTEFRRQTFSGKRWAVFAKGGAYSPFYADLHLVVNWERDGEEIRNFIDPKTSRPYSRPQNTDFYFLPGLTWSDRTTKLFSARVWPAGGVFSVKGSAGFFGGLEAQVLGLMNSLAFNGFLSLMVGAGDAAARSYQVGTIGAVPWPGALDQADRRNLETIARSATDSKRRLDAANETSHVFTSPAILQSSGESLAMISAAWHCRVAGADQLLLECQREIDNITFRLYGFSRNDRRAIEEGVRDQAPGTNDGDGDLDAAREEEEVAPTWQVRDLVADLLSYAVGCAFGRWDVRFATGERLAPELPDPFAPLPVCSPSMLTGNDGLPLHEAPPGYALRITRDGILVDDPGPEGNSLHQDDIVRRVREVLELIWGERAEAIEKEACEILGVEGLRDYFRNPRAFFDDHIKRYSKSRRKAPIYWLLQSAKRSYGLWLYYHRLDRDTVFKALRHYVEPKIKEETSRLREMKARLDAVKESMARRERTQVEREVERQDALITELGAFKEALERVAALGYDPDLNDGVVLNIAPFHELTPWKEAKVYWDELRAGRYEWSTMSQRLKEKGLVGK